MPVFEFCKSGDRNRYVFPFFPKQSGDFFPRIVLLTIVSSLFALHSIAQSPQPYTSFQGASLNLYKWEGQKVMLLSKSNSLDPLVMANWAKAMDSAYNYYRICTGREPNFNTNFTYINNRTTLAEVDNTCGAGCGYLGTTGIELQSAFFQAMYAGILNNNLYDQVPFYEFGRNFWFYSPQLEYKSNDPIVTGYAVFMRFLSMDYAGVAGAPFNGLAFSEFRNQVRGLLNLYLANPSLNWANTLGQGQGVPGQPWGATDLFASFCFYLYENHGGQDWVRNVWKYAGQRPAAVTTQDAVDNFIIAASQAAGTNLSALFQSWKWPVSETVLNTLEYSFPVLNENENNTWTWLGGPTTNDADGIYGSIGIPSINNSPGARFYPATWVDAQGNYWLFGGNSQRTPSGDLNDLWRFNPRTREWTWMKGSNTVNQAGSYGTRGVSAMSNTPGARVGAVSWVDNRGNLWLFGGRITNSPTSAFLNDLWKYDPATSQWTWMHGSNLLNNSGSYGSLGITSPLNAPCARNQACGWTDATGNF